MPSRNIGADDPVNNTARSTPAPRHFKVVLNASSTASRIAITKPLNASSKVAGGKNEPRSDITACRVR